MKILVFGAGSLGSLLGALLGRRHEVSLVGRANHIDAIRRGGLHILGEGGFISQVSAHAQVPRGAAPDMVLLTVKAFNTVAALDDFAPIVKPHTIIVTAQNGLGNYEAATKRFPANPVIVASVTHGASMMAPGSIAWNGSGDITLCAVPEQKGARDTVQRAFLDGGLRSTASDNVQGTLWLKAIVNASINPLTAIHQIPNGGLLEDPALTLIMKRVCEECVKVARAEGVPLPVADAWETVERVAKTTASNRSSMLQSVERGQRTEVDAITGKILEAAKRHRIECPENQRLFKELRALESAAAKV